MKVVHLADVHLGIEGHGRVDPGSGLSTRVLDVVERLAEVAAFVKAEDADLVVVAGDAFRTSRPAPTLEALFAEWVRRVAAVAPVVLVAGCHDQPRLPGLRSPLDIYRALDVAGVTVCGAAGAWPLDTRAGAVWVACLPWGATATAADLAAFVPPGATALLVAHVAVEGASVSSSQAQFGLDRDRRPLSSVIDGAFPYVALGHVHRHQVLRQSPSYVAYSGSLERADFGEEGEAKGFMVAEIEGAALCEVPRFVPVAARPFLTIDVDVPDAAGAAGGAMVVDRARVDAPGAVVRIRVRGSRDALAHVRAAEVAAAVGGASSVAVDFVVQRRALSRRNPEVAAALNEVAALDAWLEAHPEMPRRDLVRQKGRALIAEVVGAG